MEPVYDHVALGDYACNRVLCVHALGNHASCASCQMKFLVTWLWPGCKGEHACMHVCVSDTHQRTVSPCMLMCVLFSCVRACVCLHRYLTEQLNKYDLAYLHMVEPRMQGRPQLAHACTHAQTQCFSAAPPWSGVFYAFPCFQPWHDTNMCLWALACVSAHISFPSAP